MPGTVVLDHHQEAAIGADNVMGHDSDQSPDIGVLVHMSTSIITTSTRVRGQSCSAYRARLIFTSKSLARFRLTARLWNSVTPS